MTIETASAQATVLNPNRKIFEARKRETAALGAGEKLVLGHPSVPMMMRHLAW